MKVLLNPLHYRSPQRVWDAENRRYTDKWRTTAPFRFAIVDEDEAWFEIPSGFEYDKASVPRMVWWYLPRDGRQVIIAALVHDYLYSTKITPRDIADRVFYDLLRQSGMRWSKARAAYLAVRSFGWLPWGRK